MIEQIAIRGYDKNFSYFIVGDSGKVAIVDPGDVPKLEELASQNNFVPVAVLITHSHHDHVEGVKELAERYKLPVYMQEQAKSRVETGNLEVVALKGAEIIELDGRKIEVIHTPGHIDDAVCYLVDGEALLTGDTLFVEGCGRADFANSNVGDLWESLEKIRQLKDEVRVYPGHDYGSRPVSSIGWEKAHNKYLLCESFEEFWRTRMG